MDFPSVLRSHFREGEDGGRRDISGEEGTVDVSLRTIQSHIEGADHEKESSWLHASPECVSVEAQTA